MHGRDDAPAIIACHANEPADRLTRAELREQASRVAAALQTLGVQVGDHVAAIARNDTATVVVCLAAAAIGASFCTAPPEMGEEAILSRLAQLSPRILVSHTTASGQPLALRVRL